MNDKLKHSILKKKQEALSNLQLVNCFQFLNFTEKVSTHVKQVKIKILLGYSLKFVCIWQLRKFIFLVLAAIFDGRLGYQTQFFKGTT